MHTSTIYAVVMAISLTLAIPHISSASGVEDSVTGQVAKRTWQHRKRAYRKWMHDSERRCHRSRERRVSGCKPKMLVIGIDSGDWDTIDPLMEAGYLPTMARLIKNGVRAELDCYPSQANSFACFCPPVWKSFQTGQQAQDHKISNMANRSYEVAVATLGHVLHHAGGEYATFAWHNSYPLDHSVDFGQVEFGAEYRANEYYGVYLFSTTAGEGLEGHPEEWEKPANLYRTLRMHKRREPSCRDSHRPIVKDRTSMEMLKRVAKELTQAPRIMQKTAMHELLWHSPDKEDHITRSLYQELGGPIREDVLLALAAAYEKSGPACPVLDPDWPFNLLEAVQTICPDESWKCYAQNPRLRLPWSTVVDTLMELDDHLAEVLAIYPYDYVVFASDHGMERIQGRGLLTGHHSSPNSFGGIFAISGPGIRKGVDLGTISVLDPAPNMAYALELPIAQDLDGTFIEAIFTEEWLKRPPEYVPSWDIYLDQP